MKSTWKSAAIAASVLALTPALSLVSGNGSAAYAHTSVSGSVVIGGPNAVFGFSYGDPFAYGHVHYQPIPCSLGPMYYYPAYGVYAHYYPAYRYYRYYEPVVVHPGRGWGHHKSHRYYVVSPRGGYSHHRGGHGHGHGHGNGHSRGHGRGNGKTIRGHHYDD